MGNFMNGHTKAVTGFKLGSLARIHNVKDHRNQLTLLEAAESAFRKALPQFESFVDDFQDVMTLEKTDIDQLVLQARNYISNIKNVQQSLDSGNLSDASVFHPQDRVLQVVKMPLMEAREKAEFLSDHLSLMLDTYDQLLKMFGEDPQDENARKRFFKMIAEFLRDWKVCSITLLSNLTAQTTNALLSGREKQELGTRRRSPPPRSARRRRSKTTPRPSRSRRSIRRLRRNRRPPRQTPRRWANISRKT